MSENQPEVPAAAPEPAAPEPVDDSTDDTAEPVPVAVQKAAGVPPEDTVTIADQKAGVPAPELPDAAPEDAAGGEPPRDEFTAAAGVPPGHHVRLGDVLAATANFFARNPELEKALLTELSSAFKSLEKVG